MNLCLIIHCTGIVLIKSFAPLMTSVVIYCMFIYFPTLSMHVCINSPITYKLDYIVYCSKH